MAKNLVLQDYFRRHVGSPIVYLSLLLIFAGCAKTYSNAISTSFNNSQNTNDRPAVVVASSCDLSVDATKISFQQSVIFSARLNYGGDLSKVKAYWEGTNKLSTEQLSTKITPELNPQWSSSTFTYSNANLAGDYTRRIKFIDAKNQQICITNSVQVTLMTEAPTPTPTPSPNPVPAPAPTPSPSQPAEPVSNSKFEAISSGYNTKFFPGSSLAPTVEDGTIMLGEKISLVGRSSSGGNMNFFRMFIPPGTQVLQSSAYLYVAAGQAQVAMKLNTAPTSLASQLVPDTFFEPNTALQQLMSGQELTSSMNSSYGGSIKLSGFAQGSTFRTTVGGWIYINLLSAPTIPFMEINYGLNVDSACYKSWFANARFDADGNPVQNAVHSCAGTK